MLTALKPVISEVRGFRSITGKPVRDAFEHVGEPISIKHMCAAGIKSLFGRVPRPLKPCKIELTAIYLPTDSTDPIATEVEPVP